MLDYVGHEAHNIYQLQLVLTVVLDLSCLQSNYQFLRFGQKNKYGKRLNKELIKKTFYSLLKTLFNFLVDALRYKCFGLHYNKWKDSFKNVKLVY